MVCTRNYNGQIVICKFPGFQCSQGWSLFRDEDEEDSLMMKNYMIIATKHMCMKRLGYPSADGKLNTM